MFEVTVKDNTGFEIEDMGGVFFDKSQASSFYELQIEQANSGWTVILFQNGKEVKKAVK